MVSQSICVTFVSKSCRYTTMNSAGVATLRLNPRVAIVDFSRLATRSSRALFCSLREPNYSSIAVVGRKRASGISPLL